MTAPDREADAFRRGAEAMREAAAQWHEREAAHIEAVDGPDQALWSAEHREHAAEIRSLPLPEAASPRERVTCNYDDFSGDVIGTYRTREGKEGVVVQQDGTRVVHVYGRQRVSPSPRPEAAPPWRPIITAPKDGTQVLLGRFYWPPTHWMPLPPAPPSPQGEEG